MVCNRCIAAVKGAAEGAGLKPVSVQLGEVELEKEPNEDQSDQFKNRLEELGFELLDNRKKQIIEKIKTLIIEKVHHDAGDDRYNLSEVISAALHKDYSYISHLFSEVEGTTIEKFYINQKIEKAKELLAYDEKSLSEIAWQLGYSSTAHLSAQFKKVTGLTPSHFRNIKGKRKTIDKL